MCDPVCFPNVTPELFAAIAGNIERHVGTSIAGDTSGRLHHSGCAFDWRYDPHGGQLLIQCVSKPFFVSCDTVNDKLNELFRLEG